MLPHQSCSGIFFRVVSLIPLRRSKSPIGISTRNEGGQTGWRHIIVLLLLRCILPTTTCLSAIWLFYEIMEKVRLVSSTCLLQLLSESAGGYQRSRRRKCPTFKSFKIRLTTFLNFVKLADVLISRLWNYERVDRVGKTVGVWGKNDQKVTLKRLLHPIFESNHFVSRNPAEFVLGSLSKPPRVIHSLSSSVLSHSRNRWFNFKFAVPESRVTCEIYSLGFPPIQ